MQFTILPCFVFFTFFFLFILWCFPQSAFCWFHLHDVNISVEEHISSSVHYISRKLVDLEVWLHSGFLFWVKILHRQCYILSGEVSYYIPRPIISVGIEKCAILILSFSPHLFARISIKRNIPPWNIWLSWGYSLYRQHRTNTWFLNFVCRFCCWCSNAHFGEAFFKLAFKAFRCDFSSLPCYSRYTMLILFILYSKPRNIHFSKELLVPFIWEWFLGTKSGHLWCSLLVDNSLCLQAFSVASSVKINYL